MTAPQTQTVAAMLAEFHAGFGQSFGDGGSGVSCRLRLHREEYAELLAALDANVRVWVAHELADVVYVCYGTAFSLGVHIGDAVDHYRRHHHLFCDQPLSACHELLVAALKVEGRKAAEAVRSASLIVECRLAMMVAECYALAEGHGVDLDAVIREVHAANMRKADEYGRLLLGPVIRRHMSPDVCPLTEGTRHG